MIMAEERKPDRQQEQQQDEEDDEQEQQEEEEEEDKEESPESPPSKVARVSSDESSAAAEAGAVTTAVAFPVPIWKSVAASYGPHHYPSFVGFGNLCYDFRNSMEPEPARCRRTDGKKWRCSTDVVPDQKYCERHMESATKACGSSNSNGCCCCFVFSYSSFHHHHQL